MISKAIFVVTVLWIGVFAVLPASAESVEPGSVCYKIIVDFDADEDSVIAGQIGIHYFDDDREELVNVTVGPLNVVEGKRVKVAEVRVTDMRDFSVSLNTAGTILRDYKKRVEGCSFIYINDGRLNIDRLGSLAVIYDNSETGGYDVYGVNPGSGEGRLVIRASRAVVNNALARALAPGGANTLIQASSGISLWALTSNECQLNSFNLDGSLDEFVFACAPES